MRHRMMRTREDAQPVAFNPHIAWSEPSSAYAGWTFFAALLVALLALIFTSPFESVRLVYTLTVSARVGQASHNAPSINQMPSASGLR